MDAVEPRAGRLRRAALGCRVRLPRTGERGQGMVEYAFILALIVIVLIVIVTIIGKQTNNMYSNISNGIGG
jgi:Flp pilus assembly pilin Flp